MPSCRIVALTATATKATKGTICDVLMMSNPRVIFESPNRRNVTYSLNYMDKNSELECYFDWLVEDLKEKRESCARTIIYCQTIRQCSLVYASLKGMLGKNMYMDIDNPKTTLVEMLHSCTPSANKENILGSFADEKGIIRVLVATIAFGMGVDCKAVSRVIHFGPSKNIESYAQETGRAGRDGSQSVAFLLYNGVLLAHVEPDIKAYVMKDQCRRVAMLNHFEDTPADNPQEPHFCCDFCARNCQCGSADCGQLTRYPTKSVNTREDRNLYTRTVDQQQREHVNSKLKFYFKTLLTKLLNTAANTDIKTLTAIPFVLGFSETQIQQVMDNLEHLFSLEDICNVVEIWDMKHAHKILSILKEEFNDTEDFVGSEGDFDFDDLFLNDWENLLDDEELFEMAADNLSVSQLQETFTEAT